MAVMSEFQFFDDVIPFPSQGVRQGFFPFLGYKLSIQRPE
jgi:hypothetical protein